MVYWLLIPAAYQLLAIAACVVHFRRRPPACSEWPSVSILKPSPTGEMPPAEALASHEDQDYPVPFELIASTEPGVPAANPKAGKMQLLGDRARYPIWVVNDADIRVPRHYLRSVVAALMQPGVGVVTCLYKARGDGRASRFEAFGVTADLMPSVLVARLIGVREFGLGATLAFRRSDLARIGGFEALSDYIADDYQLAKRITELGLRAEVAAVEVETSLHGGWREVWTHQVRWARTIRCSRPGGYLGLPVAHAGVWALAFGNVPLVVLRIVMAWVAGAGARSVLAPVWDLFAFAVWIAGWTGNTVVWRGETMTLDGQGRIRPRGF